MGREYLLGKAFLTPFFFQQCTGDFAGRIFICLWNTFWISTGSKLFSETVLYLKSTFVYLHSGKLTPDHLKRTTNILATSPNCGWTDISRSPVVMVYNLIVPLFRACSVGPPPKGSDLVFDTCNPMEFSLWRMLARRVSGKKVWDGGGWVNANSL